MVPPSARFPTRRAALAEEAARRALAGLGPELVLPQLRAQTVQELLAQPGGAGCELCGTLQTLTGALTQCVRRRPGWLYAMFPSGITCPVPARPALVQAAVLEAFTPCLGLRRAGGAGSKAAFPRCAALPAGRRPRRVLPLWQALARQSGGAVVFDSGAQFAAAAFFAPLSRSPHAKIPQHAGAAGGSVQSALSFFVGLLRGTVVSMAANPHRPMQPMAKLVSRVCSETLPRTSSKMACGSSWQVAK